ncbi:uncharacterized protein LOC119370436 [Jatropha curcas]|uniref:uncharacterized protein LOC119370436 n=1 Tax=Jatropha curcas TaxID=180498 RepID=UPI0018935476|nr:uncharacterized protein LOC119370436 [Jatropha curcas]
MEQDSHNRSLDDEEEEGLSFNIALVIADQGFEFFLVGMLLTYSPINFTSMKSVLVDLWHPLGGITITDIGAKRFLFRFYNQVDMDRTVDGAPWLFNKNLLVWSKIKPDEDPLRIPLITADVWVIVKNLKPRFMREEVAKSLGDFAGKFVSNDAKYLTESAELEDYSMRIRTTLDIRQPLRRMKKLLDVKGEAFYVWFSYERIFVFCYLCGLLGHTDSYCEIRLRKKLDELIFGWDERLRALPRRNRRAPSQWLCENGKPQIRPWNMAGLKEGVTTRDDSRLLYSQIYRTSLFVNNSNLNGEGDDFGLMETESIGRMSIGGLEDDSGPIIHGDPKKRPRSDKNDKNKSPPANISLTKDLLGGNQVGGNASASKISAGPVKRDSRKQ